MKTLCPLCGSQGSVKVLRCGQKVAARGFTLIELLVVVSIIALLVSILLPALGAARDQAHSTKCKTNLRAIAMGMLMYATDYNDWLPANDCDATYEGGTGNYAEWLYPHRLMKDSTSPYNPTRQPLLTGLASVWVGGYLGESYNSSSSIPDIYYCSASPLNGTRPTNESSYCYRGIASDWANPKNGDWRNNGTSNRTADPVEAKLMDAFKQEKSFHGSKTGNKFFSNVAFSDSRVIQINQDIPAMVQAAGISSGNMNREWIWPNIIDPAVQ